MRSSRVYLLPPHPGRPPALVFPNPFAILRSPLLQTYKPLPECLCISTLHCFSGKNKIAPVSVGRPFPNFGAEKKRVGFCHLGKPHNIHTRCCWPGLSLRRARSRCPPLPTSFRSHACLRRLAYHSLVAKIENPCPDSPMFRQLMQVLVELIIKQVVCLRKRTVSPIRPLVKMFERRRPCTGVLPYLLLPEFPTASVTYCLFIQISKSRCSFCPHLRRCGETKHDVKM